MSDGGIWLLAVFLLMILAFTRQICVALSRSRDRRDRYFLAAVLAGVMGFLAQGMTDYSFYNYPGDPGVLGHAGPGRRLGPGGHGGGACPLIRVLQIISDTNIGGGGRSLLSYLQYYDRSRFHMEGGPAPGERPDRPGPGPGRPHP